MKKIEIEIPDGKWAEWVNGVLTLVDDDVRVRIKTFEDACAELGENHQYVRAYREWMRISYAECEDITAYIKLRIITAALNEGWEPQFTVGEYRYWPWFWLYTQEEVDAMTEAERSELLSVGGYAYYGALCGLSCAYSNYAFSRSGAAFAARLAFKSHELAKYAGRQFIELWSDFSFKPVDGHGTEE